MTEPADPIRPPTPSDSATPHPLPPQAPPPQSGPPHPGAQYPAAPYPGQPYPGPPPGAAPYSGAPYPGPPPAGYHAPPPGGYGPPPGYPPMVPWAVAPNGQPLAGFGDRLVARLIDGLILGAVSFVLFIPLFVILIAQASAFQVNDQGELSDPGAFFVAFLLFYLGFTALIVVGTYVYEVEMMYRRGQTVGKRVMKIRVIPLQPGRQLTRGDAAKRWAVYQLVGFVVPLFNWIDGLWQLWDKPFQQCLHDKAAGTVVVKVSA